MDKLTPKQLDSDEFQYEAIFRVNLGTAVPEINDFANEINTCLSKVGYDEKLVITSDGVIPPLILTCDRELTREEEYKMKRILEAEVIQHFKQYDVKLVSFSRKSGNVQQSASSVA